jgi:hypothetical protein
MVSPTAFNPPDEPSTAPAAGATHRSELHHQLCYQCHTMVTLNAHFDGKVIVPDEPLALKPNQRLRISVEPIDTETDAPKGKTHIRHRTRRVRVCCARFR